MSTSAPGKVTSICWTHCIFALACDQLICFFRVGSANAQYGRWDPTESYQTLSVCGGDLQPPFHGFVLRCSRTRLVAPYTSFQSPLHFAFAGPLDELTEDSLAHKFMNCDKVTTYILRTEPDNLVLCLDQWRVTGIVSSHELCSADHLGFPLEDPPLPPPSDPPPPPAANDSDRDIAGGSTAPDFASLFHSGTSTRQSGQRARQPTPRVKFPDEDSVCGDFVEGLLIALADNSDDEVVLFDEKENADIEDAVVVAEAHERVDEVVVGGASASGASSSSVPQVAPIPSGSPSALAPATPPFPSDAVERTGIDADTFVYVLAGLQLEDRSSSTVWRFSDARSPLVIICEIHAVGRPGGETSLKATCKRRAHVRCGCWITKMVVCPDRVSLMRDLISWFADGREDTHAYHQNRALAVNIRWGMKPR